MTKSKEDRECCMSSIFDLFVRAVCFLASKLIVLCSFFSKDPLKRMFGGKILIGPGCIAKGSMRNNVNESKGHRMFSPSIINGIGV